MITQAVLLALMLETAKLSGLAPITEEELPLVTQVSQTELSEKVCGKDWDPKKHCEKYRALYFAETNELVYLNTLNMDTDFNKSILVHELVHALQRKKHGVILKSCQELVDMEAEAYVTQDRYMSVHGHYDTHLRNIIQYLKCPPLTEVKR